jgi:hypothetical protein
LKVDVGGVSPPGRKGNKMKLKKIALGSLIIVILIVIFIYGFLSRTQPKEDNSNSHNTSVIEPEKPSDDVTVEKEEESPYIAADDVPAEEEHPTVTYNNFTFDAGYEGAFENTRKHMMELSQNNYDVWAWMLWDTGMVQTEIMKSDDNQWYLNHAANAGTTDIGQPFFDENNNLKDDHVITVYSYSTADAARLAYLSELGKQVNYEQNKTFLVEYDYYADWYQVDCVFELSKVPGFEINKYNFTDKADFKQWYVTAKEASTINSGLKSNIQNYFMVLSVQTGKDTKVIIVAKRLKRYYYSDFEK